MGRQFVMIFTNKNLENSGKTNMERILENQGLIHVPEHIFGFLDITSITKCLRVSKQWQNFLKTSKIWLIKQLEYLIFNKKYFVQDTESEFQPILVTLVQVFPDWQEVFVQLQKKTQEELELILEKLKQFFFEYEDQERFYKSSPLHYACRYGHLKFLEILFKIPSLRIQVQNDCQESILDFAMQYGQVQVMKFLLNFNLVTVEDLYKACRNGQLEIVKLYFDHTILNLLETSTSGATILHLATRRVINSSSSQKSETVLFILQKSQTIGLDVNQKDYNGYTALHDAVCSAQVQLVRLYLDHAKEFGIDVHAQNDNGATILHMVFLDNFYELATMIMDNYYEEFQWDLRHRAHGFAGFTPLDILERNIEDGLEQWKPMAEFIRNKIQN